MHADPICAVAAGHRPGCVICFSCECPGFCKIQQSENIFWREKKWNKNSSSASDTECQHHCPRRRRNWWHGTVPSSLGPVVLPVHVSALASTHGICHKDDVKSLQASHSVGPEMAALSTAHSLSGKSEGFHSGDKSFIWGGSGGHGPCLWLSLGFLQFSLRRACRGWASQMFLCV